MGNKRKNAKKQKNKRERERIKNNKELAKKIERNETIESEQNENKVNEIPQQEERVFIKKNEKKKIEPLKIRPKEYEDKKVKVELNDVEGEIKGKIAKKKFEKLYTEDKNKEKLKQLYAEGKLGNKIKTPAKNGLNFKKKSKQTEEEKKNKEKIKNIIIYAGIALLIIEAIALYLVYRPKFKDIQIELGTKEINPADFLVSNMYVKNSKFVTNINTINLAEVGEYDITLAYRGREQTVKLKIADTVAPTVTFRDNIKYIDYVLDPNDFIAEKKDESEMTVELVNPPEITEFKDYVVTVKVKDKHGNETMKDCKLTISWIKTEVTVEMGTKFALSDLIFNADEFGKNVSAEDFAKINTSIVGEYIVNAEKDGVRYQSKIKVQDTTPPDLELKDISIYDTEQLKDYKDFIVSIYDASGEPTTTLKTEIEYGILGNQDIVIEATDANGNKVEKTAILTIKKDTDGPSISGLKDMYVAKHSTIDFYSGVSAYDRQDGACEFTVDSRGVDTSVAGTYYATYTSKDKKGNTTTAKRRVTVDHDAEDTTAKFNAFYDSYLAGKDIVSMAHIIRTQIRYSSNWGGDDPVWYGLTNGAGNCYVHANIMQRALSRAGYTSKLIWLQDQSHYWILVNVGGVWRHVDATPSSNHTEGLLTDEQKLADPGVHGKTWDRSAWPAAQ